MTHLTRRALLFASGAATLAAAGAQLQAAASPTFDLRTRRTSFDFGGGPTHGLASLADAAPPPVIRLKQGQPAHLRLTNGLDEYSTMHWHGIRLPNAMDGVPYLTQFPIAPGDNFDYRFTPPDAGTYWYHPHCRTMAKMAQGLTGALIVEEADDPGFDADIALNLKDFRLAADHSLLPHFTPRGAARGGTLGNVTTINWRVMPVLDVPAGALVRLRFVVTDVTRIFKLALPSEASGRIIAWDGQPIEEPIGWPTSDAPLWMGPGQRVDIVLRTPDTEGAEIPLINMIGRTPHQIGTLRTTGPSLARDLRDLRPLPRNPYAVPNMAEAEKQVHELVFGWTPEGNGANNGFCGTYEYTFWSINRAPWPGDAQGPSTPLATLDRGKSYLLRLRNESPNLHPIHLHGLLFKPVRSSLRPVLANYTDTYLLMKNEVVDVALVADNPGDWALHCHVIEHQKTGLSGFIRVT